MCTAVIVLIQTRPHGSRSEGVAIPHYNMRWSSGSPFGVVNVTENLAGFDCFANVLHLDSQWSISPKFFSPIPFF